MSISIKAMASALVCVAALFVPSYIAVANYIMAQNAPVDEDSISTLEITDINGNLYTLSAGDAQSAAEIADFIAINDRAVKQTSLPEPLVGTDYFEFKFYSYDRVSIYKYYFTLKPNEAYFVDSSGEAYHISESDAEAFLSTAYARCLYNTTDFPTMTISGNTVDPVEGEWAYQTYSGEYVPLDDITLGTDTETVRYMEGAFVLNFDDEPDLCTVTIRDGDTVIYNDLYANIANASLEGKTVDVVVDAKWYQTEEQTCYGSAKYIFKAKILLPAVFYLGETSIEPGEFVVITAKNVEDPSTISFTSEPDIGFTPTFFMDGDYARALIPIDLEFTGSSVDFTFTCGEVTQQMTLDITPKEFGYSTTDISYTIISQTRTESTLQAFDETMAPIWSTSESSVLWEGNFLEGIEGGTLNTGFGRYRTITATGETYRHPGVDYYAASGTDVLAVNSGKVVYVGYLDLTGYTIVIDHGIGLKSIYCHMQSTSVEVGAMVAKGDVIGKVGSTGFTAFSALHVGLMVFDVPVCPYDLWENGVIMTN